MTSDPAAGFDIAELTRRLMEAFQRVADERMAGVPILNPALKVEAIGARPVEGGWLTVLVTPWCINLMALPGDGEEAARWTLSPSGAKVKRTFPAGVFEFTMGAEEGLGPYQMCSLFSPVLEFVNHEAAVLTAEAALDAMFDASLDGGNGEAEAEAEASPESDGPKHKTAGPSGVTRRGLLFGGKP